MTHDTSMQQIARNETLAAAARVAQLVGIPTGLALMAWLGTTIVAVGNNQATLSAQVAAIQRQQDATAGSLVSLTVSQDARWQFAVTDMKANISEIRAQLDRIILPARQ